MKVYSSFHTHSTAEYDLRPTTLPTTTIIITQFKAILDMVAMHMYRYVASSGSYSDISNVAHRWQEPYAVVS